MAEAFLDPTPSHIEPQGSGFAARLNWLRAGVLGANDGIISTAGLVVGVAGATASSTTILIAGLAGLVAGSLSMAGGEYVSVSSQRDAEIAILEKERRELAEQPELELEELAGLYQHKGLSADLAHRVAEELTAKDALRAHAEAELGIDADERTSPTNAAIASMISFAVGALLPLLAMVLTPTAFRLPVTTVAVLLAVAVTGAVSARLGQAPPLRAVLRNIVVGALAMGLTYVVGRFVGA